MSEPIEVKKLVLNLNGKEVSLSIDQAKKLFKALDEMFGVKTVRHEYAYSQPWTWGGYPTLLPLTTEHTMPKNGEAWCENGSGVGINFNANTGTLSCSL